MRRDKTSRDPQRLDPTSKNLVVQILHLVPSESAGQTQRAFGGSPHFVHRRVAEIDPWTLAQRWLPRNCP
jgi:hypothetical protein